MRQYESEVLKNAIMKMEEFDSIKEVTFSKGDYTKEQIELFREEFKSFLVNQYDLEMIDFTNIQLDNDTLKEIFQWAGTSNIHISQESNFYQWLQQEASLSEQCKNMLGVEEHAKNLEIYQAVETLKKRMCMKHIVSASDLRQLSEFINFKYFRELKISINSIQDMEAFQQLQETLPNATIVFLKEGFEVTSDSQQQFRIINHIKEGTVRLSKSESLFYSQATNKDVNHEQLPSELKTEDLVYGLMLNRCIPMRALPLIDKQITENNNMMTFSIETEEDRATLESYKNSLLKDKSISLASSVVTKLPPEVLERLNVKRVMIGIDENEHGKYDVESYQKIYQKLKEITNGIDNKKSDYAKFGVIYERLSNFLKYDFKAYEGSSQYNETHVRNVGFSVIFDPTTGRDVSRISNLEGLINHGECICEGFSEILKQSLALVGIESHLIAGKLKDSVYGRTCMESSYIRWKII